MKRQKVTADPVSKASSGSPALPAARTPPNQRPQQSLSSQPSKHSTPAQPAISVKHPASAQPIQLTAGASEPASVPSSAPTPASGPRPSAPVLPALDPEILDQVVAPTGHKFGQLMERLAGLDKEIAAIETQMSNAQHTGQTTLLPEFQKEGAKKAHLKEQIKILLKQHYQKVLQAKEAQNTQAGTAGDVSKAGPDPPSVSAVGVSLTQSQTPSNAPDPSTERPAAEEHRPQIPDSQILAQFWQSRGGTVSAPSGNNLPAGPSQAQLHPSMTPEVAAQMQKLIDKKGFRPQSFGSSSQASTSTSQDTIINPNAVTHPALNSTTWHGTFTWSFPQQNGATKEVQIQVVGIVAQPTPGDM
jgi:hypothetical protein